MPKKLRDFNQLFVIKLTMTLLIIIVVGGQSIAQAVLTPLWPDRGIISRDQLWSLSLTSPQQQSFMAFIEVTVSETVHGTPVLAGVTGQFLISPGANTLSPQNVQPVTYTNLSTAYVLNLSSNTVLPPGIFNVCYRVLRPGGEETTLQGEACFVLESDPLTPPSLVLPADKDTVVSTRPFFTWLPPVSASSLAFLNYSIRVAPREGNQSPQEAVERNLAVFTQLRMTQANCQYPAAMQGLDSGRTYAWQILAYNDNSYVCASECWQFKVGEPLANTVNSVERPFVPMEREGNVRFVRVARELRLRYNNEAVDSLLVFNIREQGVAENEATEQIQYSIPGAAGENYLTIDLEDVSGIKKNTKYVLCLMNSRGERWWMDFQWNSDK